MSDREKVSIGKGSWLRNSKFVKLNDGVSSWATFDLPHIQERESDEFYRVSRSDRPELISERFYNRPDLWWVIALLNNIRWPEVELYPGRRLRIPDPGYIIDKISGGEGL